MLQKIYDYNNGIYCVESGYEGEGLAAIYFVVDSGRAAIVDTAHNGAVTPALRAMEYLDLRRDRIDYILLTHVHLDHAGGAGLFMREFGHAKLVVHPRGARHMIDPGRLMDGVRAVYGPDETERMYGELLPVSEERIIAPEDGRVIALGKREIACMDTPGHARHHLAFHDRRTGAVFTGDAFGMSYPQLDTGSHQGIIPTTSPTQFDPNEMIASMDKIMALNPPCLYPTHFGEIRRPEQAADDLKRQIGEYVRVGIESGGDFEKIRSGLVEVFAGEAAIQGWPEGWRDVAVAFAHDINMNAKGVKAWFDQTQKGKP